MWKTLAAALAAATLLAPKASALENEDLLSLVAMPLAVATVSEIADVPVNELIDVVTLLNQAAVPPPQFIEVVRYVPVALVEQDAEFVEFVRMREQEGLRGSELVTSIAGELRVYGLPEVDLAVTRPRTIDIVEDQFLPRPVRRRLAEVKAHPAHPHGGPPGQLKKAAGTRVVTKVVQPQERPRHERKLRPRDVETHSRMAAREDKPKREHRGRGNNGKGNGNGNGKGKG
jgi:hypothetical protein